MHPLEKAAAKGCSVSTKDFRYDYDEINNIGELHAVKCHLITVKYNTRELSIYPCDHAVKQYKRCINYVLSGLHLPQICDKNFKWYIELKGELINIPFNQWTLIKY